MTPKEKHPSAETLKGLHPLKELDLASLQALAHRVWVHHASRETPLMEIGATEPVTLYLLEGELEMHAADGNNFRIRANDMAAKQPLCQLRPSKYRCVAAGNVQFLRIENAILEQFLANSNSSSLFGHDSYSVIETITNSEDEAQELLIAQIVDALFEGRMVLPSLNPVAQMVGRAILNSGRDPRAQTRALMLDPCLAAKAIKAVNSSLEPQEEPVKNCENAVLRLGPERLSSLAINCVLRETLRERRPGIAERMRLWWERSLRVAAISEELARQGEQFDPKLAALAGLLHRIGEAAILGYANQANPVLTNEQLDEVIANNRPQISLDLLSMWNHPQELLTVVSESGNHNRNNRLEADYADIVLVAERHADIGQNNNQATPLDQMPSFQRLGLEQVSPNFSLEIVQAASQTIRQANAGLAS